MSIINEALKKAIQEKEQTVSVSLKSTYEKSLGPNLELKKPSTNWGPIFILLVLLLVTGPMIAPAFTSSLHQWTRPSSAPKEVAAAPASEVSANRKGQFGVEEAPLFRDTIVRPLGVTPYLNLTGIVFDDADSYCIINDKVVKIGDSVRGAIIRDIKSNKVLLDFEGQSVLLYINR